MKSFQQISQDGVPYIPEEVLTGKIPFVAYVPQDEYIFSFREIRGKLIYGRYNENVVCVYEKRGPLDVPNVMRLQAFKKAYRAWKE